MGSENRAASEVVRAAALAHRGGYSLHMMNIAFWGSHSGTTHPGGTCRAWSIDRLHGSTG